MKPLKLLKKPLIFSLFFSLLLISGCKKELDPEEVKVNNKVQNKDIVIRKDFELKPSWFGESNTKSSNLKSTTDWNWQFYANYGKGRNALTGQELTTIFKAGVSLDAIVSNSKNEFDKYLTVETTNYEEIDEKVSSTVKAGFGLSYESFSLNSSLSIENQSTIKKTSKSVYVSIISVKRMGISDLVYHDPSINNYLIYKTNLQGGADGITISNTNWRTAFGDEFRSQMSIGTSLIATFQVTDVDYNESNKSSVTASVKTSVQKIFYGSSSFEQEKALNVHMKYSQMIIDVQAIPRKNLSYYSNINDVRAELDYNLYCYNNQDFGIINHVFMPYNTLYPTYVFLSYLPYSLKIEKWNSALNLLNNLFIDTKSPNFKSQIATEISKCNSNIKLSQQRTWVPDPANYNNLVIQVNNDNSYLYANEILPIGKYLISPNGYYILKMQTDGNLVLYLNNSVPLWSSKTNGKAVTQCIMQPDGNFVLYNGSSPVWSPNTWGNPGAYLKIQDDGNIVIYSTAGRALWARF